VKRGTAPLKAREGVQELQKSTGQATHVGEPGKRVNSC